MAMQNKIAIIIPARIGSSRFPEKMLCDVGDMKLIERVFMQCKTIAEKVVVATDSIKIMNLFPDSSVLTPTDCKNGTERCSWAVGSGAVDADFIINVQGDMVNVPRQGVLDIAQNWIENKHAVSTLVAKMPKSKQDDPNTVKCIHNDSNAKWFGRGITGYGSWHYGIYGYSKKALLMYPKLTVPKEEDIESLEQLRWIQNNIQVNTIKTKETAFEINTPEDQKTWLQIQSK